MCTIALFYKVLIRGKPCLFSAVIGYSGTSAARSSLNIIWIPYHHQVTYHFSQSFIQRLRIVYLLSIIPPFHYIFHRLSTPLPLYLFIQARTPEAPDAPSGTIVRIAPTLQESRARFREVTYDRCTVIDELAREASRMSASSERLRSFEDTYSSNKFVCALCSTLQHI